MKTGTSGLLVGILFLACNTVAAAPVTWYLNDFVFTDGGTASGSFVMDSANLSISAVDIVTTSGDAFGGGVYTNVGAVYNNVFGGFEFFTDDLPGQTGESALVLFSAVNPNGGTYEVRAGEFSCINESHCGSNFIELRDTAVDGTLTTAPVPLPAAAWLFVTACAALASVRRSAAT